MTVSELIEQLQKMPQNAEVSVVANGYDGPLCRSADSVSINEVELVVYIEG